MLLLSKLLEGTLEVPKRLRFHLHLRRWNWDGVTNQKGEETRRKHLKTRPLTVTADQIALHGLQQVTPAHSSPNRYIANTTLPDDVGWGVESIIMFPSGLSLRKNVRKKSTSCCVPVVSFTSCDPT